MRPTTALLVALPFVVAACAGDTADTDDSSSMMADTSAAAARPVGLNLTLASMNNSGVTAGVTLAEVGDSTSVAVELMGAAANAKLPHHIHAGTCEAQGAVVMPLDSLTTDANGAAMATTLVNIPMSTVANGQHYIQVHGTDGQPTACGNVTARAAGSSM